MADEDLIQDAYYVRDLVNYSNQTKELAKTFFDLLMVEQAITSKEIGEGVKINKIRDVDGKVVDTEVVLFSEKDYHRRSGIIEGLSWLEVEVKSLIQRANEEDTRKAKENEAK